MITSLPCPKSSQGSLGCSQIEERALYLGTKALLMWSMFQLHFQWVPLKPYTSELVPFNLLPFSQAPPYISHPSLSFSASSF